MDLQSQIHCARVVGIADRTIRRWIKAGKLKRYGKQIDLDEVKKYAKFVRSDPVWVQKSKDTSAQNAKKFDKPKKDIKTGIPKSNTSNTDKMDDYSKVRMHREAFQARSAELKYRKEAGELIPLTKAMEVFTSVLEYYNTAIDNMPIALRNKDDTITPEQVENMFEHINEIKENTSKIILELEWE